MATQDFLSLELAQHQQQHFVEHQQYEFSPFRHGRHHDCGSHQQEVQQLQTDWVSSELQFAQEQSQNKDPPGCE